MVEITVKFKVNNTDGNKIKSFFKDDVMKDGPFGFLRASDEKYLDIEKTSDYKVKVGEPIKKKVSKEKAKVSRKKPKLPNKKK